MKITGKEEGDFKLSEKKREELPTLSVDESSVNANGGTEMMKKGLYERLPEDLKDAFQIICSRVRQIDENRPSILWLHDTWDDPESAHLRKKENREKFAKLIFVSYYQFLGYHWNSGVGYDESLVLRNAIEPIAPHVKSKDGQIKLIYHTTPHRGLELLYPVFEYLCEMDTMKDKIHLDVFSSFEVYGWGQRDNQYKEIFEKCKNHPHITYHGAQPNDVVRKALEEAHIFAYPSIWPETSCIAAIEAMSAGCNIICPSFGALPETTANFARMYPYKEDYTEHANFFGAFLHKAIEHYWDDTNQQMLNFQKNYTDVYYNWDARAEQWKAVMYQILDDIERNERAA